MGILDAFFRQQQAPFLFNGGGIGGAFLPEVERSPLPQMTQWNGSVFNPTAPPPQAMPQQQAQPNTQMQTPLPQAQAPRAQTPWQRAYQTAFGNNPNGGWGGPDTLALGLTMLGESQNGGNWGNVAAAFQNQRRDVRDRQYQQRTMRREDAADARETERFGQQRAQWQREGQQRQSLDEFIAGLPPEQQAAARANPVAAHQAYMEAQASANAPITPYQQANLQLSREEMAQREQLARIQEQGANYRAGLTTGSRPLRGADRHLMEDTQEASQRTNAIMAYADQFQMANRDNGTGFGTNLRPDNLWDANRAVMRSSTATMTQFMRQPGSGAVSDFEQRIFREGAPRVELTGPQNDRIIGNMRLAAQVAQDRRFFYEDYAEMHGTLNGAERAFQQTDRFRNLRAQYRPEQQQRNQSQAGARNAPRQGEIVDGYRFRGGDPGDRRNWVRVTAISNIGAGTR